MNLTSCENVRDLLVDYIEGEVASERRYSIKHHLDSCLECNDEYNGIKAMLGNADSSSFVEQPDDSFWKELPARVLQEVRREQQVQADVNAVLDFPDTQANNRRNHPAIPVFALAATVVLVVSAVLFWSPQKTLSFNPADFQASIDSDKDLISLAHKIRGESQAAHYGMFSQTQATSFSMGNWLSETITYLHSNDLSGALGRLDLMAETLSQTANTASLGVQLGKARTPLQFEQINRVGSTEAVRQSLKGLLGFQHAYENYLGMLSERDLVLFKTSIWTYNIALAALAKDVQALAQFSSQAQLKPVFLKKEMVKIKAPSGVINILSQIDNLVTDKPLDDRQFTKLVSLLDQLRALLV